MTMSDRQIQCLHCNSTSTAMIEGNAHWYHYRDKKDGKNGFIAGSVMKSCCIIQGLKQKQIKKASKTADGAYSVVCV